ncbi:hypothetical protein FIBSPDRAFT_202590 [Athelia psychrophila]|uniref:Uncharacterized protein n=1 Tax=Athelia psychrophila TaxID=1759441 RepID=A0A165ZH92_9AGAM|nr:hypothetical protein FIBSPDRAFT_202590 [Fibularhizoctonia sp. CBS 109695]
MKVSPALGIIYIMLTVCLEWTKAHAFLVIMGGYQFYDKAGPRYALEPDKVIQLVRGGEITPPTAAELADRNKGDILSKCVAIMQTLWFVTQCIARYFERLHVTNLEVITLAYTLLTVAIYIAWWNKPLNIACAFRVSTLSKRPLEVQTPPTPTTSLFLFLKWLRRTIGFETGACSYRDFWNMAMDWIRAYIDGTQDDLVNLEHLEGVPTFWTGKATSNVALHAHVVSIFVAVLFAGVHYTTWSYAFPSPLQQQLWRWSTVAITSVPVALLPCLMLARMRKRSGCVGAKRWSLGWWSGACGLLVIIIGGPIYICARGTLFVLSFTTMISLPIAAYRTVQWSEFIPHI